MTHPYHQTQGRQSIKQEHLSKKTNAITRHTSKSIASVKQNINTRPSKRDRLTETETEVKAELETKIKAEMETKIKAEAPNLFSVQTFWDSPEAKRLNLMDGDQLSRTMIRRMCAQCTIST
mmetsp:Transcript_21026/g.24190  ORF Transcript_21026/g.24190 Transcript_21026/m.24190 type:complete len:121 (+) Transcript_21026:38-400(+)